MAFREAGGGDSRKRDTVGRDQVSSERFRERAHETGRARLRAGVDDEVGLADATGIVLDGGTLAATVDLRAELALNEMAGALSTGPVVHDTGVAMTPSAVAELFAD